MALNLTMLQIQKLRTNLFKPLQIQWPVPKVGCSFVAICTLKFGYFFLGLKFVYLKPCGTLTSLRSKAKIEPLVFGDISAHFILANEREIDHLNKVTGFQFIDDNLSLPLNLQVKSANQSSLDKIFLVVKNSLPEYASILVPPESQSNTYRLIMNKNLHNPASVAVLEKSTGDELLTNIINDDDDNGRINAQRNGIIDIEDITNSSVKSQDPHENNVDMNGDKSNKREPLKLGNINFAQNPRIDRRNMNLTTKEFLDKERAKNTVLANKQHWGDFTEFIAETRPEEKRDLTKISTSEFADHLKFYFQNVLKKKRRVTKENEAPDTGVYNASVFTTKLNAIKRQMHFLEMPPLSQEVCTTLTDIIKKRQKQSSEAGETSGKNRAYPFSREHIAIIINHGQLGHSNPYALRNKIYLNFNVKFGLRPRQEMYNGTMSDIEEGPVGANGIPEYLKLSLRIRKNLQGNKISRGADDYNPKLYSKDDDPENCPVRAWYFYKSKKNPQCATPNSPLFHNPVVMNPEKYAKADIWYGCQRTSINTLGEVYKKMAEKSGIDPKLCHIMGCTGRKLTINSLGTGANTNSVFIAKHTGQTNVDSQMSYLTPGNEDNMAMDTILDDAIAGKKVNSFDEELKRAHAKTTVKINQMNQNKTLPSTSNTINIKTSDRDDQKRQIVDTKSRSCERNPSNKSPDRSRSRTRSSNPRDKSSSRKRSPSYKSRSRKRSPSYKSSNRSRSRKRSPSYKCSNRSRSRKRSPSYKSRDRSRSRKRSPSYKCRDRSRSRKRSPSYKSRDRSRSRKRRPSYRSRSRKRSPSYKCRDRSRSRKRSPSYKSRDRSRSRKRSPSYRSRSRKRSPSYKYEDRSRSRKRSPSYPIFGMRSQRYVSNERLMFRDRSPHQHTSEKKIVSYKSTYEKSLPITGNPSSSSDYLSGNLSHNSHIYGFQGNSMESTYQNK